jgi:hypothetical protein
MKFDVGEQVLLIDGTQGKVTAVVTRRASSANAHRMVKFTGGSRIFHVDELLPFRVESPIAPEPTKAVEPDR